VIKRFTNKSHGWGLSERKTITHHSLQILNMTRNNLDSFGLLLSAIANSKKMVLMPKIDQCKSALHTVSHSLKITWHCLMNGWVAVFCSCILNMLKYLEMSRQKHFWWSEFDADHFTILHLHDLEWLERNWLELWWTNVI